uniref:PEGA domain-containing protein n=1 Tax=Parastrongyloides trichosuri TaxID=131310 RepID=A0A0N4ZDF4_PARTI
MVVSTALLLSVVGDPDVALLLHRIEALEAKNAALQLRVDALASAASPTSPQAPPPPIVVAEALRQSPQAARERWEFSYVGIQAENAELIDFLAVSSPSIQFDRVNANTQHAGLTVGRRWQVGRIVLGGEFSASTQLRLTPPERVWLRTIPPSQTGSFSAIGENVRLAWPQASPPRDQADFEDQAVKHRRASRSSSRQRPGLPPPAPWTSGRRRRIAGPGREPSWPRAPGAPALPWSGCSSCARPGGAGWCPARPRRWPSAPRLAGPASCADPRDASATGAARCDLGAPVVQGKSRPASRWRQMSSAVIAGGFGSIPPPTTTDFLDIKDLGGRSKPGRRAAIRAFGDRRATFSEGSTRLLRRDAASLQGPSALSDQGQAAEQFGDPAQARSRRLADQQAEARHDEGGEADAQGDQPDIGFQQGQAHAYGARVDRGAHSGRDQGQQAARRGFADGNGGLGRILVALQRLPDHLDAQRAEQAEGDPVVEGFDEACGRHAQGEADQGRDRLDHAEHQAGAQGLGQGWAMLGASADGGGEGVGGHAEGQHRNGERGHHDQDGNSAGRKYVDAIPTGICRKLLPNGRPSSASFGVYQAGHGQRRQDAPSVLDAAASTLRRRTSALEHHARPFARQRFSHDARQPQRFDARRTAPGSDRRRDLPAGEGPDARFASVALDPPLRRHRLLGDDRRGQGHPRGAGAGLHPGAARGGRAPGVQGRHAQMADPHGAGHRGRDRLHPGRGPGRRSVRLVTGRLHPELHLLPHRHAEAGPQPDRGRDRGPGPGGPRRPGGMALAQGRPPAVEHRLHGHGRAALQSRQRRRRHRHHRRQRGHRPVAPPDHGVDLGRRAAAERPGRAHGGHAGHQPARHQRRPARRAGRQRQPGRGPRPGQADRGHPVQGQPDPVQPLARHRLPVLGLEDDRDLRRHPEQGRLRFAHPHAARARHPGRLRPAEVREREAAGLGASEGGARSGRRRLRPLTVRLDALSAECGAGALAEGSSFRARMFWFRSPSDREARVRFCDGLSDPDAASGGDLRPLGRGGCGLRPADAVARDRPDPARQSGGRRGLRRGAGRAGYSAGCVPVGVDLDPRHRHLGRGDGGAATAGLPRRRLPAARPAATHREGRGVRRRGPGRGQAVDRPDPGGRPDGLRGRHCAFPTFRTGPSTPPSSG